MAKNNSDHPFPERLKRERLKKQITQRELGIAIGISEDVASARMNQYEKGVHIPKFDTVKKIAQYMGVPSAYFYCEEDELAELIRTYEGDIPY